MSAGGRQLLSNHARKLDEPSRSSSEAFPFQNLIQYRELLRLHKYHLSQYIVILQSIPLVLPSPFVSHLLLALILYTS